LQAWRDLPQQLAGWHRRQACVQRDGRTRYVWQKWLLSDYSIVLTKGMLMHQKWLAAYTNQMPTEVLDFVREHKNCEDLAMQFLVSNRTRVPPQYVAVQGCALAQMLLDARARCMQVL
jgi:glucuronyl/N-acetylglucosaminyl transferase EXT2